MYSIMACGFFLVNLILTIHGILSFPSNHGILLEGNCGLIKKYNTGLHVLINLVSTVQVSGSNYCMQCIGASNRHEVDRVHVQDKWLNIGIPSSRNLDASGSAQRIFLYFFLMVSSMLLHLT
jgi:hypothetical protein